MSELRDMFRARAAAVAATASALDDEAVRPLDAAVRRARRRRTAVQALGAAAAVVLVGGVGVAAWGLAPDANEPVAPAPSATTTSSPSPTPTNSPSATPSLSSSAEPAPQPALIDGFAPVPQLPASEVPWDEVGPGWFLVSLGESAEIDAIDLGETFLYPELDGGVSLVSPAGAWFAVEHLDQLGTGFPLTWDGSTAWMATAVTAGSETGWYDIDLVSLEDGSVIGSDAGVPAPSLVPVGTGAALAYAYGGDGLSVTAAGADAEGMGGCSDAGSGFWGWEAHDMSFLYQPDGAGRIVCFGPAEDSERTEVVLVEVGDVAASRVINEFVNSIYRYAFIGWVDSDTFLFARRDEVGADAEAVFAYDLADDGVTEVDLSMYRDIVYGSSEAYFDHVSQRHIVTRTTDAGWSVELFALDGTPVATFEGTCADASAPGAAVRLSASGGRASILCPASGELWLHDLATGAEVGSWSLGADAAISVFDHPDWSGSD